MSNLATITNNILADSGIDDINVIVSTGSYANPAWITSLAWTKITGAPANIVTGTGNNNYIAKFSSTGSTIGNSLLQSDANNVFIAQEDTIIGIDAQSDIRLGFVKKSGFPPRIAYATDSFVIASSAGPNIFASNTFTPRLTIDINGVATFSSSVTATSIIRSGGTSSQYLMADGSVSTLTNPVIGTGSAGQVAYWSSSSAITGESNLFWDATNDRLGINVNTPQDRLDVNGSIRFRLNTPNFFAVQDSGVIDYVPSTTDARLRIAAIGNSTVAASIDFFTGGVDFGVRLRISPTGTATFSNTVTAGSGADGNGYLLKATNGTPFRVIDPTSAGGASSVNIGSIGTAVGDVRVHATNVLFLSNDGNNQRMTILANGNVGMGTPSPSVASGLGFVLNSGSNQGRIAIKTISTGDAAGDGLQIGMSGIDAFIEQRENASLDLATNAQGRIRITSGGKVLINSFDETKTPLLLNAEGNFASSGNMTSGFAITNTSFGRALNMGVFESGAYGWIQAAYINNADTTFALVLQPRGGNVGIGTNDPKRGLHISGTGAVAEFLLSNTAMAVNGKNFNIWANPTTNFWNIRTLTDDFNNTAANFINFATITGNILFNKNVDEVGKVQIDGGATTALRLDANSGVVALNIGGTGNLLVDAPGVAGGRFIINAAGNVGIGTPSPATKLHIASTIENIVTNEVLSGGQYALYRLKNSNYTVDLGLDNTGLYLDGAGGATRFFNGGGSPRMTIASGGSITMSSLAGSGNRIVVANSGGTLISAVIGSGLAFDGTTLTATGGGSGSISGSGSSGTIALFTGTSSIGNSVITQSSSNVGVGTGTPNYKLNVFDTGVVIASGQANWSTNTRGIMVDNINNGDESVGIWFRTGNNHLSGISGQRTNSALDWSTDLRFYTHPSETSSLTSAFERMRITSEGFIGIGTLGFNINNNLSLGRVFGFVQDINSGYIQANMANSGNYIVSQFAVRMHLDSAMGEITFLNAPSGTAGSGITLTPRLRIASGGNVLINTTSDNGNRLRVNGTIFSDSSITATSFFESSDATLKTLIADNYQAKGIDSVVAKLYIKNGKEELGYFAQDLESILPSAVSKGSDGLLNLSYREVHTAKIAYLEERIKQLEKKYENN